MTADLSKWQIFATFPILHISHPNERFFLFELSCGHLVVIFITLEGFPESRKNWSFRPPRPCRKVSVLLISHFCIFLLQISNFFTFELSCGLLVMIFINYYGFPESRKKIEVFDDCGPVEKANFSYFPNYACFSSKWVNYYIWVVLWSSGDDFHHFRRLSRRSKKLSFRWLRTCRKSQFFPTFSIMHISHQNEWIFTFELSCGHLVMIFIILEGSPESRKNWSFRPPQPSRKSVSFANLKFLHISPPNQ